MYDLGVDNVLGLGLVYTTKSQQQWLGCLKHPDSIVYAPQIYKTI